MRFSAVGVAAAITCLSTTSFAQDVRGYGYGQDVRGYGDAPGARIEPFDYGMRWQYHGGPKSTSTTGLAFGVPGYQAYGFGPPPDRY
jgi:hypothetical protein